MHSKVDLYVLERDGVGGLGGGGLYTSAAVGFGQYEVVEFCEKMKISLHVVFMEKILMRISAFWRGCTILVIILCVFYRYFQSFLTDTVLPKNKTK